MYSISDAVTNLKRARNVLQMEGWCRGNLLTLVNENDGCGEIVREGTRCALGALVEWDFCVLGHIGENLPILRGLVGKQECGWSHCVTEAEIQLKRPLEVQYLCLAIRRIIGEDEWADLVEYEEYASKEVMVFFDGIKDGMIDVRFENQKKIEEPALPYSMVFGFNDDPDHGFDLVLGMYDVAIAIAESELSRVRVHVSELDLAASGD